MKTTQVERYQCEICETWYESKQEAAKCESRPVSQDKGVKVGDIVLITQGDGAGETGKVKRIFVYSKDWGHYAWDRYWHTVALDADIINSWGTRQLSFDSYEATP
jgi:hypothetical protein